MNKVLIEFLAMFSIIIRRDFNKGWHDLAWSYAGILALALGCALRIIPL